MICKKCGAYNPDHATFCKVCAASLKEQPDTDEEKVTEAEEVVEEELRPKKGNVKAPDFSAARRAGSFKAAQKVEEPDEENDQDEDDLDEEEEKPAKKSRFAHPATPVKKRRIVDEDEDEDDEEDEDEDDEYDEEEEVKPAKRSLFARPAAPAKKRPAVEEEEDDEDEDEDEEDEYDEDEDAEKLESEPKTTRFARTLSKKRRIEEDDEDDDEEDDEDEDDDEEDDEDYEEYEPTPPRRKKSSRSQGKSSGSSNIVAILIVCLLAILLLIVGIVAFCNIKGGSAKAKLPSVLQFNCAGKTVPEKTVQPQQQDQPTAPAENQITNPTDAPVTGTPVDYSATTLEELIDGEGKPCISISMTSRPGDTVTIVLPNQDDYVVQNNEASDVPYQLTIPKSCYFPNTPLTDSVYTVTPQILVAHADGTQESLHVDSFDITFPTIQLELVEPAQASIPAEGIMAAEGNMITLKGKVDDHTVTVTVNGQPVTSMYEGGNFEYVYTLPGDNAETVTIEASKANCVSSSYAFTATPYVFIPEPMPLTVASADISKLLADKNNKVTVTGTTAPGATLTATPAAEYQSSVVCGAPNVDPEGNYSFEVTFDKSYYGIATITIHAKKDGYEEGETNCLVYRMYNDRQAAIKGYSKTKDYHEVPSNFAFTKVMENPTDAGLYRFVGKVVEVDPETGVVTFSAKTSNKETVTIYVLNASAKWDPVKGVGKGYKLYSTLNGLYTDGASLYITAWFAMND